MKRIFALLLVCALCFAFTGCGEENKYAELEKLLDEGRYSEAMSYILFLQGQEGSAPVFGVITPGETVTDEDLAGEKEPDAEVLEMIQKLMGEWIATSETAEPQKIIFRPDGTCAVDGKEMTWKREATSLTGEQFSDLLSVWEGETRRYMIQETRETEAGEIAFVLGKVDGMVIGYGETYICPDRYEVVKLTMENWQEYFEFAKVPSHSTNAFGDVTGMEIGHRFVLKEEYLGRLSERKTSSGDAEFSYTFQRRHAKVNADGKTFSIGEPAGEGFAETTIVGISGKFGPDGIIAYFGAPIASDYLQNYSDVILPGEAWDCRCVRDISLLRIQGELYLIKPQ